MNKPPDNRIGKFKISKEVIRDWKKALQIMHHFVVIRVDWRFVDQIGEYTAYSKLFESMEEGVEPFCYEIVITRLDGDRPPIVTAKRTDYFA